ncbi:MAG: 23S rRNA (adenine(2503)-C(2))-methyltransferase RlmN [Alphaproteobacteria bacterium]
MMTKTNICGYTRTELKELMTSLNQKPFRAKQLFHWMYNQGETDFDKMTSLSKDFRTLLAENFVIERPEIVEMQTSADGTRKWLLRYADGVEAETVFIPEEDRGALCVSSQVGCNMACTFCHTGTMKVVRNLTAAEIISQVLIARDSYGEWPSPNDGTRMISNIVMMGMGEPLENYDEVKKALLTIMDEEGISLSKRRITLSTCGIVPEIKRCGEELGVNLAISLHATNDALRSQIMPINYKYSLNELMEACRTYPAANNARRITFEYIMLKDMNDSPAHARELVKLTKGVHAKFNLIPFNPWAGSFYEPSSRNAQRKFAQILNDAGLSAPIRVTRGQDIDAACGQLKTESTKRRRA